MNVFKRKSLNRTISLFQIARRKRLDLKREEKIIVVMALYWC